MKFGNEYASQMVPEWLQAYMDYKDLKTVLKDVLKFRQQNPVSASPASMTRKGSLNRRLTMYRAFSGLTSTFSRRGYSWKNEDEVILVAPVEQEGSEECYKTIFLMSSANGGEYELEFFRRLDDEFNKVLKFYKAKVRELTAEAEELSKQMDALLALRIRVNNPLLLELKASQSDDYLTFPGLAFPPKSGRKEGLFHTDVTKEGWMNDEKKLEDKPSPGHVLKSDRERRKEKTKTNIKGFSPAPLEILDNIKINVEPESPISTLRKVLKTSKSDLSFSKEELKIAEEKISQAFVEFYQKLRLLKSYSFHNLTAFSKIMKKYDKIALRNASKVYLEFVDNSYLGSSDEVDKLVKRVEATFVKHFFRGNRRKGMRLLRPQAKRQMHRVTFILGFLSGCSVALVVAVIISIHAGNLLQSEGRGQYMENIFPLYSLFGYIALHMVMLAANTFYWRRYRVNYPFIFGFKQGTELGHTEILLLASGLSVLALAAVLSNLDMEMDPYTKSFQTLTELVPLFLVIVLLLIILCPLNIIYRSSRFFLIKCAWHCLCAPLYKVTLPDFFLGDQLTSQVQAIRSLQFYVCYYGWGDFKRRSNKCHDSDIYKLFYIVVAVLPYWARLLQCLRRLFEEKDIMHGLNSLKFSSIIIALVMRTSYEYSKGMKLKIIAAVSSGIATIASIYWDLVIDWGLLRKDSKNPWLRDKILVPHKKVYFVAMVMNVMLRLVWMQLIFDFQDTPLLHRKALVAIVGCLEIFRRGIWNFFRVENEHLNNVGKYRAFKSVPLPFHYNKDKHK